MQIRLKTEFKFVILMVENPYVPVLWLIYAYYSKNAKNCYCISTMERKMRKIAIAFLLWKEKCAKLLLPFSVGNKRAKNCYCLSSSATREQKMCAGKLGKTIGRGQATMRNDWEREEGE